MPVRVSSFVARRMLIARKQVRWLAMLSASLLAIAIVNARLAAQDSSKVGATASAHSVTGGPANRTAAVGRVLGVFDDQTNVPLHNVEVVDVLAEKSFRTEESGLIGLAGFRRQNDSAVVRVRKLGYSDTTFLVMLGAVDTVPVQLFLHRVTTLPRVVTEALETGRRNGALREFVDFANDRSLHVRSLMPFDLRKHDEMSLRQVLPSLGYGIGECKDPRVYLNGMRVSFFDSEDMPLTAPPVTSAGGASISAKGALSLDDPLANYEAIQYFPDWASPIQYGKCTLLLWMRGS